MELDGSRTASSAGKLAGVLERGTDLFAELQHEDSSIPPLRQSASESWTLMRAHRQQPSISLQTLSQFNPLPHSDGRGNRPNGRPSRYLARTRPRVCRAGHARPRGHLRTQTYGTVTHVRMSEVTACLCMCMSPPCAHVKRSQHVSSMCMSPPCACPLPMCLMYA